MSPQVCRWPSTSTGPTDLRVLRQWRCGKPFTYLYCNTPENQPSTWRWMVWNTSFLFGMAYFQGRTVSFGEGNVQFTHLKRTSAPQLGFIFSSFCPMNMNIHPSEASFKLNVFKLCEGMAVLLMSNICPPWGFCVQQNQESSICGMRKYFIDSRYVTSLLFYSILNTIKRPKWIPQANHSQPVTPNP